MDIEVIFIACLRNRIGIKKLINIQFNCEFRNPVTLTMALKTENEMNGFTILGYKNILFWPWDTYFKMIS